VNESDRRRYLRIDNLHTLIGVYMGLVGRLVVFLIVASGIVSALLGRSIWPWSFSETNVGAAVLLVFLGTPVFAFCMFVVNSLLHMALFVVMGGHRIPDEFYETTTTAYNRMQSQHRRY